MNINLTYARRCYIDKQTVLVAILFYVKWEANLVKTRHFGIKSR